MGSRASLFSGSRRFVGQVLPFGPNPFATRANRTGALAPVRRRTRPFRSWNSVTWNARTARPRSQSWKSWLRISQVRFTFAVPLPAACTRGRSKRRNTPTARTDEQDAFWKYVDAIFETRVESRWHRGRQAEAATANGLDAGKSPPALPRLKPMPGQEITGAGKRKARMWARHPRSCFINGQSGYSSVPYDAKTWVSLRSISGQVGLTESHSETLLPLS